MKVAIIGPGALGCLFAVRLTKGGIRTTLVDHHAERIERLKSTGIRLQTGDTVESYTLPVVSSLSERQDLIIVLVKSNATSSLVFPPDTPVLTLQNGLGNVEIICTRAGSANVLAGTTSEGAILHAEGHSIHTGSGVTKVGAWTSCPIQPAFEALSAGGFNVERTDAPGQVIWEKVSLNAGINPLTALLNIPNRVLLKTPEVRQLLRDLVVEAAKVAATEGYRFPYSLVEKAEEVCELTGDNISSMLQDIRAGKLTEIDAISGEILRRGQLAGLQMPRTRVVWQLVKGLERIKRG